MYEYQYVNLQAEGIFASKFQEHRAIIDRHAAEGWRYVGYLPTHMSGEGGVATIDLIFEREHEGV